MKSTSIWYTKSRNKYSTHTWSFSHEYAPHIVLVRIISRQPHPGLLHQPEEAAVLGLPPPVALPLALAALARHRPLHLGRARQDDVGGARQHQDRRRVLAQLVVQLLEQQIYLGRIWWKLQSHNSILKMYFLACAYYVVLITNQFWIIWFFGKDVIFRPKNAFFWKKWLFHPQHSKSQQSCFRTFCWGANFLPFCEEIKIRQFPEESVRPIFIFLPLLFHQF